jgi:hypothetical protein
MIFLTPQKTSSSNDTPLMPRLSLLAWITMTPFNVLKIIFLSFLPFIFFSRSANASTINVIDSDFSAGFTDTGSGDRDLETELESGWHGEISNTTERWDLSGGFARFKDSSGRSFSQAITISGNDFGSQYQFNFDIRIGSLTPSNSNQDLYLHVICWNVGDTAPLADDQYNDASAYGSGPLQVDPALPGGATSIIGGRVSIVENGVINSSLGSINGSTFTQVSLPSDFGSGYDYMAIVFAADSDDDTATYDIDHVNFTKVPTSHGTIVRIE